MPIGEIYMDTVGLAFKATIRDQDNRIVDISQASSITFKFSKPNMTSFVRDGQFVTDGTDGLVQYVTVTGDLNLKGNWKVQAKVILPDGEFPSDIYNFQVLPNL